MGRGCADRRIILASVSPRRKELLKLICPEFEIVPSSFDESGMPPDMSPKEHVAEAAKGKAQNVAARVADSLVIGADTVVALDEHILGKPCNEEDATRMLKMLSGRTHQVYTGVHVIDSETKREVVGSECTEVRFRELTDDMIVRYTATGEPMDKAGAYGIQGRGAALIEGISGCFFNVVGLPVYRLGRILEEFGLEVFGCG